MPFVSYMSIKGERQGLITSGTSSESSMGAKWQEHHENEILVYGYSGDILNAGGKREHQPLVIVIHKTILQEFYQTALRKRLYTSLEELQQDLDEWLIHYNTERTHQGKQCCGRTPMETLMAGKEIWKEKFVA